ncbi:redoxin domain-containing protein [Paenibacillus lactis]|uniref:redoxin domain-containing protein n=1 Tax=Paenibacillus lactis TaxID=228574 RepID=UPI00119CFB06
MIRRMIQFMLLMVVLIGGVYAVSRFLGDPQVLAIPGEAAPEFSAVDLEGTEIRLADYKGKGVVLNFWTSWCNPCVNELPLLNEAHKLTGVDMLAINVGEGKETVQHFADRYDLEFPIVLDSEMNIKQRYQLVGMPLTIIIDEDGTLVERHEGELTEMEDIIFLMNRIRQDD